MKRPWESPKLLVLVRNRPEEAVLGTCKHVSPLSGPQGVNTACYTNLIGGGCYDECHGWNNS